MENFQFMIFVRALSDLRISGEICMESRKSDSEMVRNCAVEKEKTFETASFWYQVEIGEFR